MLFDEYKICCNYKSVGIFDCKLIYSVNIKKYKINFFEFFMLVPFTTARGAQSTAFISCHIFHISQVLKA